MSLLARRIKPLVDRVLIKRFQVPKKTTGGLYLPESAQKDEIPQGIITAVGPGAMNHEGKILPMNLQEGDEVLLPSYGGQEFKIDEDEFVILRETEVIAKLDK
mmetsp:Transcript_18523/g.29394  ORF Transcript_18523/g.29394 Transcript_18523/m.29394 type:complete len:103 (+) Transcript_18523:117-425(+)|eukprot:CAMPEP_0202689546 /NCGR_PEP_ID=MMETSP1385-20130828/4773_1 /ASSEMBLY_ACC=CAM_ASM_000861 /TAXON_ID=933848 /ORGANISM="Elphidium margaritaceum" /LENGTH=102 /DNA_ID=CAMNT_0049344687 /DNA_START=98 /DNA_END=406 /DNA_ORIENTATION=+